jgi:hypothetical protein
LSMWVSKSRVLSLEWTLDYNKYDLSFPFLTVSSIFLSLSCHRILYCRPPEFAAIRQYG